jgi:hypothetical protein
MREESADNAKNGATARFTRRGFMGATVALGGVALAPPFEAQLSPQVGPTPAASVWIAFSIGDRERPIEQVERFVLSTALPHSPPIVLALAHSGGHGFAQLAALRSRAASCRGRGLLIHRSVDLERALGIRSAMQVDAAIDGWDLRLPSTFNSAVAKRFEAALEITSRMARHVVWVEAKAWTAWLPALDEAAVSNPWLSFVVVGAFEALSSHEPAVREMARTVLRQPNVLVHFDSWRVLSPAGRRVLDEVGSGRIVWGIQDCTATAVVLDPFRFRIRLGPGKSLSVLASRAVSAYGLQPHHYTDITE